MSKYKVIIGLEIHIEPNTTTKMFCGCPQDHFGKKPNSQVCPICMGLPGVLPIANYDAIKKTILLGLALNSKISKYSNFYRKHYFYPDLPKSFQTSQKDNPFCIGGELLGKQINHIHLEEDAGKLIHETIDGKKVSLVDFNRSGCALIELVTEPVFENSEEVTKFTKELQLLARYLDISNADMEKGTMRLEANISLQNQYEEKEKGKLPDYKVELKNINSFRFLSAAIEAEIVRQKIDLENGKKLRQETRGYNENTKKTFSQRSKEESQDYRYFPEPDLPPIKLTDNEINKIKNLLPELPNEKRRRFVEEINIPANFAEILVSDKERADYFEEAVKLSLKHKISAKMIADVMVNQKLDENFQEPALLVKKIIELTKKDYAKKSDVENAVKKAINDNTKAVKDYHEGKGAVIGFLIGQVQKELKGKGDINIVRKQIENRLKNDKTKGD